MKEKLLSMLMAMMVLLSTGAARAAIVDSGSCGANGNNLTWTLTDEGVLTISGRGEMKDGDWFWSTSPFCNNESIKTIVLSDGVTSIGSFAFNNCYGLTSIELPASVTSIGNHAFDGCDGLTSIELPASLTSIGDYAFYYCVGLSSIEIPASVMSIGECAFLSCNSLTSIIIDANNPMYDSRNNCNAIIETATNTLVAGCKTSEIPTSVTSIGSYAFYNCSGLSSIELPASVTSIGDEAFYRCSGLSSIEIPASVTSIGNDAFQYCSVLSSIEIPASVTSIGSNVFASCNKLTSITVSANNFVYDSRNNCNAIIETATNTLVAGCTATKIPTSVTSIGNYAFYDCDGLTSIELPASVTSIGNYAYYDCAGLTSIELPASLTSIGNNAFQFCYRLSSIELPASVTSIGSYAFADCDGLTSVYAMMETPIKYNSFFYDSNLSQCTLYVPDGSLAAYQNAGWNVFDNIQTFTSGTCGVNGDNLTWTLGTDGVLTISGNGKMNDWNWSNRSPFYQNKNIKKVVLNEGVTSIGSYAFEGCSELTSIEISGSLTSIGDEAFYCCSGLSSIEIPASLTSIGDEAFYCCSGLSSIEIPASVTSIDSWAFWGCSSLTSIIVDTNNPVYDSRNNCNALIETETNTLIAGCKNTVIPETVTSIGYGAFWGCSGLTSIEIPASVTSIGSGTFYNCSGLTSIVIPETVTNIGEWAFYNCSGLTSIVIPETVTSIGDWAFGDCSGLMSIVIPASVTSIGDWAFRDCSGLMSIVIPASVTSIGSYAFAYCDGLTSVYAMMETPIKYNNFFYDSNLSQCTLYVPAGAVEAYRNAVGWKWFGTILEVTDQRIIEGPASYHNPLQLSEATVTYTRNFGNTEWQALYVPFSISSEDWSENYEVAYINSVRQYDSDSDGAIDETIMDIIKIASGTLRPNTPYLIRAKATGEQSIVAQHATLKPTEQNSISCSTMLSTFTFTGTYETIAASTLIDNGFYAMGGGSLVMTDGTSSLKPFRWYMDITSRSPIYDAPVTNPAHIRVRVVGEQDEAETHLYRIAQDETVDGSLFNLQGQRIGNQKPAGLHISNGKLQFIK